MGNEIARDSGGLALPPDRSTSPGTGAGKPVNTKRNSDSAAAGTGSTAGAGKAGTGSPAGEKQSQKISGLPDLTPAAPVPEAPKKQTKRKPRKTKKEEPESFNAPQISALILSTSAIIGSRPGMGVWTLQPEEATQIATPIANMIAKSEKLKDMGQYADAISLVTASLVIFAPRAIVFADQKKKEKIAKNGGVQLVRTDRKKQEAAKDFGRADAVHAANGEEPHAGFGSALPSIVF